jgi:hypothetical protein
MKLKFLALGTFLTIVGGAFFVMLIGKLPKTTTVQPPALEPFINSNISQQLKDLPLESLATDEVPVVESKESVAVSGGDATLCPGLDASNFDCYEEHFATLVATKGIKAAFQDLRERYPTSPYIRSQCHPLTHVIGREAAKKFGNAGEAYVAGDPFCWSGYYHGVLEGVIGKIGLNNIASQMNSICESIPGKDSYSFDYYNCLHGLGHGVMAITTNELFQALRYCDNLVGDWEQKSCASGAFMENVIVDGKNHFTKYLDPKRPLYPCDAKPEDYPDYRKYVATCYLMQTSYMLKVNGGNFAKTFTWCADAEEAFRTTCYSSLGRDASGRSISDPVKTKATCLLGTPGDQQTYCVIGAVKDFISYHHSDVQAKELCNSFEDPLKSTCLSTTESYYKLF